MHLEKARFVKTAIGMALLALLVIASLAFYEFSPIPKWWVNYQLDSFGVGRIEAMKTSGGRFMTDEGSVFFCDATDRRAQSAFRWEYGDRFGGETPALLRTQLSNARADVARSERLLRAFHAHGFRRVQLRYTSEDDVYLETPGLLLFDEDSHVDVVRRRKAGTLARQLLPQDSQFSIVFLPPGRSVSKDEIFNLQDENDLAIANTGLEIRSGY
jgi:hypothetical protein